MAYIIRMESKDGRGVYESGVFHNNINTLEHFVKTHATDGEVVSSSDERYQSFIADIHPNPYDDPYIKKQHPFRGLEDRSGFDEDMKRYRCGFLSLEHFYRWTQTVEWREVLGKKGIRLIVYKVARSRIVEGEYQCFADLTSSKKMLTCKIETIDKPSGAETLKKIEKLLK